MRPVQTSLQSYPLHPLYASRSAANYRQYKNLQLRRKRQQEVRKHIVLLCISVILVCSLSFIMSSSFSKASAPNSETYKYYKSIQIKSGDSLWTIANEYMDYHYTSISEYIDEVKVMNCITDEAVKAGNYIIIPYYSDEFKE